MLKIASKIAMGLFLVATPFLLYGFGRETLAIVSKISIHNSRWWAFAIGAAIFFPCWYIAKTFFQSIWLWLCTFEHEMSHLIIGLLFLKVPVGIRVSAHEGGEVRQIGRGTTGQTWVSLAPYFFPTVTLAFLIVAYFTGVAPAVLMGILGWTSVFHLVTNWTETSFRQPDLKKVGVLKCLLILPVMNLIVYGSILAFVGDGQKGFENFWTDGARNSTGFAKIISTDKRR